MVTLKKSPRISLIKRDADGQHRNNAGMKPTLFDILKEDSNE